MQIDRLGMVGYGEVGKIVTTGLKSQMQSVHVWDLKFVDDQAKSTELAHAAASGVTACAGMQAVCQASNFIVSAVTALANLGRCTGCSAAYPSGQRVFRPEFRLARHKTTSRQTD